MVYSSTRSGWIKPHQREDCEFASRIHLLFKDNFKAERAQALKLSWLSMSHPQTAKELEKFLRDTARTVSEHRPRRNYLHFSFRRSYFLRAEESYSFYSIRSGVVTGIVNSRREFTSYGKDNIKAEPAQALILSLAFNVAPTKLQRS